MTCLLVGVGSKPSGRKGHVLKPLNRRERIVFLLEHWQDFSDPDGSTAGYGRDDSAGGVPLLPLMSRHPSVLELARCLRLLERTGKTHYRHLRGWFCCEWRLVDQQQRMKTRSGKHTLVQVRVRERVLPPWLACVPLDRETREPRTVARGIDFLSGSFRGEVFVPTELLEAA